MTEKVEQLINEVREKAVSLKVSLIAEREKNNQMRSEIDSLKRQVEEFSKKIDLLTEREKELLNSLETIKNNNTGSPVEKSISKEEIDELVNEIEYCITQLKQ